MELIKVMSGFKDLKALLLTTYPDAGPAHELRLWFKQNSGMLSVHNYYNHDQQIIIAIINEKYLEIKLVNLQANSNGEQIIYWASEQNKSKTNTVAEFLNQQFELCGSFLARTRN
jgi:hypothetical protein